jgi:hypothetical protein
VDKPVDKFGDNLDNSPVAVDKWRINDVMSCYSQDIMHKHEREISTYPQGTYSACYLISKQRFAKLLKHTIFEEPKRFFAYKFRN